MEMLWVDKHAPKEANELVGNYSNVVKLRNWLKMWGKQKKAALVSGPPGIGKTSAVNVIVREVGFDVFELNASDKRSKRFVSDIDVNSTNYNGKKRIIVMDEVDGMSSDDRGGVQELIKQIKDSKVPIICICNDRQKPSVRTLANYCLDIKWQRPQVNVVVKRILHVAKKENINITPVEAEKIAVAQNCDLRQIIGSLQMLSRGSDKFNAGMIKDKVFSFTGMESAKFLFNERRVIKTSNDRKTAQDKRYEAFFVDYSMTPLIVQERYVNSCIASRDVKGLDLLKRVSEAADAVCDADEMSHSLHQDQDWNLLPHVAMLNVRVASISGGQIGFPGFPTWFGKNSKRNKHKRLLSEMSMNMRDKCRVGTNDLRLDYMGHIRRSIMNPLMASNVNDPIKFMNAYGITRDDVFGAIQDLQLGNNQFGSLTTKNKSAFTRAYNKANPPEFVELKGKRKKATHEKKDKKKRK